MKILYHHRIRSKDGQYVHIEELTRALAARGHEIVMVGAAKLEAERFSTSAGLVGLLRRWLPRPVYELLELAYAVGDYARLRAAVRRHAPDCLYERYNLFTPSGVWLKRRTGLPMLLEVNAPLVHERGRHGGLALVGLARWSERFAWRGADRVLPVTRVLADHVAAAGVPEERIVVIPNGIDPDAFAAPCDGAEAKRRLGLEGRLVLGFTGFVRDWNGLEKAIDALAADAGRHDLHLLLVGDGPARARLEAHAAERGVAGRLTVTGVVERDRIVDYVSAFDVALVPDVVPYASPLKLFEYMALGRAIVAPSRPNLREILTDGENALLFDIDEPGAFAAAIARICKDADLRRRLGAGARATIDARRLTWGHNAERVEALFEELLAAADRPARG